MAGAGIRSVGAGLHAALLLARGRSDGLLRLTAPPVELQTDASAGLPMSRASAADFAWSNAARSFWAAALCLPAFICLHLMDWVQSGIPPEPARGFALDLIAYVAGWAGYLLLSQSFAAMLGRSARWPAFVAVWNWCNVIQYLMLVLAGVPALLHAPDFVSETVWLVAMGWALWLEWFATKLALDIPGLSAAGMVAIDLSLGLFLVVVTVSFGA